MLAKMAGTISSKGSKRPATTPLAGTVSKKRK
jgi:hypothetical protein